jgi:hypothetical protein
VGQLKASVTRAREWARARTWKDDITLSYALCYFGLAGAFIAVPAAIWFVNAYEHFAENVVRAEQSHLARTLQYQPNCIQALSTSDTSAPRERASCQQLERASGCRPIDHSSAAERRHALKANRPSRFAARLRALAVVGPPASFAGFIASVAFPERELPPLRASMDNSQGSCSLERSRRAHSARR